MKSEGNYRVVEKLWFFALLMFAGGFYGGYTFSLRGKVFANAQTANLVMMMLSFGNGDWKKGFYAFVPLTAYIVGVCMAEFVSGKMNQKNKSLFEEKLLLFEAFVSFAIGLMPSSVPDRVPQVALSFICAMQFTAFRQAEGVNMATTFCTAHVRQLGVNLVKALRDKNENAAVLFRGHAVMLLSFCLGAFMAVFLSHIFSYYCIWLVSALHLFLFYHTRRENSVIDSAA